jgi:uncharacterized protein (TIGR03435 family)
LGRGEALAANSEYIEEQRTFTMRPAILGAGLIIFTSRAAFGQAAAESPTFEVASVKPAAPQTGMGISVMMRGGPGSADPGQITYTNVTLKNVLINAYAVKGYQLSGPKWLDSERFDIVAKIPKGATKEQFRLMLQNLLAERFKLTLHHETKEFPMYALVVGKGGPKLKESVDDDATASGAAPRDTATGAGGPPASAPPPPPPPPPPGSDAAGAFTGRMRVGADGMPQLPAGMGKSGMMMMITNGRMRLVVNRQPITALTEMLSNQLGRPVVDATGLKAKYDFNLDFAPDGMNGPMGMMPPPPPQHDGGPGGVAPMASAPDAGGGPAIFTALQEQLGLKLEQRKGPVDLLVIDRLEKVPTEN